MASFTSILSIVLLHFLFLILSPSFFRQAHKLVAADDNLIRKECNNSEVPETCIRCVKTDPSAGKADRLGIATIVVGCIGNQAKILAANMTQLGSKEKRSEIEESLPNLFKKVIQWCRE
ncbi:hypothetical protein L6164_022819 [Bauhinia variegata]|uniref:Uncharacterized protein n=1 Tax=Bauhinia variegata TaxID=167791 RepID=A0ACB9MHU9_BAUVA|nr:hypothetical protein L6164_022819 [Bauhinia variegata]